MKRSYAVHSFLRVLCTYIGIVPHRHGLVARRSDFVACEQPSERSLISAFVIHLLERIIDKLATCEISRFLLVSATEQSNFDLTWSDIPKICFLESRNQRTCHDIVGADWSKMSISSRSLVILARCYYIHQVALDLYIATYYN